MASVGMTKPRRASSWYDELRGTMQDRRGKGEIRSAAVSQNTAPQESGKIGHRPWSHALCPGLGRTFCLGPSATRPLVEGREEREQEREAMREPRCRAPLDGAC